jgi:hypothetical protein
MGYLFLSLAVCAGGIKAFCGKKISGKTPSLKNAILTNFVRMLFCIVFDQGIFNTAQSHQAEGPIDMKQLLVSIRHLLQQIQRPLAVVKNLSGF